jgi:hypothetical protein
MREIRFTPEQAEQIRNEYFFGKTEKGHPCSVRYLSRKYKASDITIRDIIKRQFAYKDKPEVIKSRLMTASEAVREFIGEQPRLPMKGRVTYATTMVKGEMLRIKKSPMCGSDGKHLYEVDTVRRHEDEKPK